MDTNILNERKVNALEHIATSLDEVARLLVIIAENSAHPLMAVEPVPTTKRRGAFQPQEKAE